MGSQFVFYSGNTVMKITVFAAVKVLAVRKTNVSPGMLLGPRAHKMGGQWDTGKAVVRVKYEEPCHAG